MAAQIRMRCFASNGLLTKNQTKMLMAWFEGTNRTINQRIIADKVGVSRNKLYNAFKDNPERPFDELKLKHLEALIKLYNEDITREKEIPVKKEVKAKETAEMKKNAQMLIDKVER